MAAAPTISGSLFKERWKICMVVGAHVARRGKRDISRRGQASVRFARGTEAAARAYTKSGPVRQPDVLRKFCAGNRARGPRGQEPWRAPRSGTGVLAALGRRLDQKLGEIGRQAMRDAHERCKRRVRSSRLD